MFEIIQPGKICDALKYLIETPLYKKYKITVYNNFFTQDENHYSEETDLSLDN